MVAVHMLSFCLDFSFFSYNQKRKTSDIVSTFALVCVNYLIFIIHCLIPLVGILQHIPTQFPFMFRSECSSTFPLDFYLFVLLCFDYGIFLLSHLELFSNIS